MQEFQQASKQTNIQWGHGAGAAGCCVASGTFIERESAAQARDAQEADKLQPQQAQRPSASASCAASTSATSFFSLNAGMGASLQDNNDSQKQAKHLVR